MRPITISLDSKAWEKAKEKTNFSAWVRDQLRSERNKKEGEAVIAQLEKDCERLEEDKEYWYQRYVALRENARSNVAE
jgi:hypothetical protein